MITNITGRLMKNDDYSDRSITLYMNERTFIRFFV